MYQNKVIPFITSIFFFFIVSIQAQPVLLNINIEGNGEIKVDNTGDICSSSCVLTIDNEQPLKLLSSTNEDLYISSWGGACPTGTAGSWAKNVVELAKSLALGSRVSIGDLNGDGLPDLAMQSMQYSNTKFVVSLSKGNGTFSDSVSPLVIESFMTDIKTFDWDNDGDLDALLVDYDSRVLYLYTNNGKGEFSFHKNITVPVSAVTVAIADINNDTYPDLLIGSFNTSRMFQGSLGQIKSNMTDNDLSWFVNDGNDSFESHHHVSDDRGLYGIDIADYDNDGDLDIIAAALIGEEFYLYRNYNNIYRKVHLGTSDYAAYDVAFGDINNDKKIDILALDRDGQILVAEQEVSYKFSPFKQILSYPAGWPQGVDVEDMDLDGDQDIVIGMFERNGPYYLLENKIVESCIIDKSLLVGSDFAINVTFSEVALAKSVSLDDTENDNTITLDQIADETIPPPSTDVGEKAGGVSLFWLIYLPLLYFLKNNLRNYNR